MTVEVLLHAYTSKQRISDEQRKLTRIPSVGEYITIPENGNWFKVEIVVHRTPDIEKPSQLDGEIFALAVDPQEVIKTSKFP
jgi:hypothetical protein